MMRSLRDLGVELALAVLFFAGLIFVFGAQTAKSQPVTYTRADSIFRTGETIAVRVPVFAAASITRGTDGVVAVLVPGAAATTGSTVTFSPPPYAARLRVNTFDGGSATASPLTCAACVIRGVNALGLGVAETVRTVAEGTEVLTANSYERVSSFSCSGCANFAAADGVKLHASDRIAVDAPLSGAADIVSVCFTEADDPATNWVCVPGTDCDVDPLSQSVDVGTCRVPNGNALAWSITDNASFRIRYRAPRQAVGLSSRN